MGFRPEPTIYSLSFQGTPLDGLHVRIGCPTVGEHGKMMAAGLGARPDSDDPEELARVVEALVEHNDWILDLFVRYLVSWDLETLSGEAVPVSRAGVDSQERNVIGLILASWQMAVVSVPNLSKKTSSSGGISEERSLGLGSSSGNQ